MTKKQFKERSLLLLSYAFMKEVMNRTDKVPLKDLTKADIIFINIYKKLDRLKYTFANKKIQKFLLDRIREDLHKDCDLTLIAIVVLYWFKRLNLTKEIVINEDIEYLLKAIVKSIEDEKYIKNSIEFGSDIVADVFLDQKGLIEFRKLTNKMPFNLIKTKEVLNESV